VGAPDLASNMFSDGVMYLTDDNAGLYLLQYEPGSS
jgi:hypothetical protein